VREVCSLAGLHCENIKINVEIPPANIIGLIAGKIEL
jgi:hypothetical protein